MAIGKNRNIAITGMACRFPGANDTQELWELLRRGCDAMDEVPESRFSAATLASESPGPGQIASTRGGFISDVECFDATAFGISPREAAGMDPQHRILLEVARTAIEDAGLTRKSISNRRVGVYVGMMSNDYEDLCFTERRVLDTYVCSGATRSGASGRIARAIGAEGPTLVVDTACSSSLVAAHLAIRALDAGEIDAAVIGGVNLVLTPEPTIAFTQGRMLAADGRCKPFDARGDGFVRSDGCAVLVFEREPELRSSRVYARIRGSAVTNDGAKGLFIRPGVDGQCRVLRDALRDSAASPREVDYVEAHGTGTPAGDPVEVAALQRVLLPGRAPGAPLWIGSIKGAIGHTEGAAGVAGLVKAALCLHHGEVPPTANHHHPSPRIEWDAATRVVSAPVSLSTRSLVGVSSFGITGTNAHVLLEGEPGRFEAPALPPDGSGATLLKISSHSRETLRDKVDSYAALLRRMPERAREICAAASRYRDPQSHRLGFVLRDGDTAGLEAYLEGDASQVETGVVPEPDAQTDGVIFAFPGQGGQWPGMLRGLVASPSSAAELGEILDALRREGVTGLDDALAGRARLDRIDQVQPLIFAYQVATARSLMARGLRPKAVVGHSMGEVAAACICGALSLEHAAAVIARRSRLMTELPRGGAMLAVGLTAEEALDLEPVERGTVSIAVRNGGTNQVLSGPKAAISVCAAELRARDVFCREVEVDVASHSPLVDPILGRLHDALEGIRFQPHDLPMISTVTGARIHADEDARAYWCRNLREVVRFDDAMRQALDEHGPIVLEVSPHPVLQAPLQGLISSDQNAACTGRRDEHGALQACLARLFTRGVSMELEGEQSCRFPPSRLPPPTWRRERHWLPPRREAGARRSRGLATIPVQCTSLQRLAGDHRIDGLAVVPGAGSLSRMWRAVEDFVGGVGRGFCLVDVEFRRLVDEQTLASGISASLDLERCSLDDGRGECLVRARVGVPRPAKSPNRAVSERAVELSVADFYRGLAARGIELSGDFESLSALRRDGAVATAMTTAPASEPRTMVIDAALQLCVVAVSGGAPARKLLPTGIGRVQVWPTQQGELHMWARAYRDDDGRLLCDARVRGEAGPMLELERVQLRGVDPADSLDSYQYHRARLQRDEGRLPAREPSRVLLCGAEGYVKTELLSRLGAQGVPVCLEHEAHEAHEAARSIYVYVAQRELSDRADTVALDSTLRFLDWVGHRRRSWVRGDGIVVATRGVFSPGESLTWVAGAPLVGLVRSLQAEWPDLPLRLLDLPASAISQDIDTVVTALLDTSWSESELVIGDGDLHGLRLRRVRRPAASEVGAGASDEGRAGDCTEQAAELARACASLRAGERLSMSGEQSELRLELARLLPTLGVELVEGGREADVELCFEASGQVQIHRRSAEPGGFESTSRVGQAALRPSAETMLWLHRQRQGSSAPRRDGRHGWIMVVGATGGVGTLISRYHAIEQRYTVVGVGRRAADSTAASAWLDGLSRSGGHAIYRRCDVGDLAAVERLVTELEAELGPLKGTVHAALHLEDMIVERITAESLERVFAAKATVAWNLHRVTSTRELEFFALCSSASAILGNPGQAAYAAATTFQNALARYRLASGLPTTCIGWGLWEGVGRLADGRGRGISENFESRGIRLIEPAAGMARYAEMLASPARSSTVMETTIDWTAWAKRHPCSQLARFHDLLEEGAAAESEASSASQDQGIIEDICAVMRLDRESLDLSRSLVSQGLDSLMAVELRNRVHAKSGLTVPLPTLLRGGTARGIIELAVEHASGGLAKSPEHRSHEPHEQGRGPVTSRRRAGRPAEL